MLKIKELYRDIIKYKNNKISYLGIMVVIVYICNLIVKSYYENDLKMLKLLLAIYIVILIGVGTIYFDEIFSSRWDQYRRLKNLEYFKILEKKAETDARERKKLVGYIKDLFFIQYFLLLFILLPVKVIFELNNEVAIFVIGITILGACLPLLKYNIFPFYVLPLAIMCLEINYLDYSIYSNFKLIVEILILYFILSLMYPAIYLRKLEKNITIMAGLVVILITLGIQAYLELDNLSELSITGRNILEKLLEMNKFLTISAYSIGLIIIRLRLNYFDRQAEKYYNELLYSIVSNDKGKIYNICKYCIFYGGESYKNRILDNKEYREVICEEEEEFLKEILQKPENNCFINIVKRMRKILIE